MKHWHRLPRAVVDVPFLETFTVRLERTRRNLVWLKMSLLTAGGIGLGDLQRSLAAQMILGLHSCFPLASAAPGSSASGFKCPAVYPACLRLHHPHGRTGMGSGQGPLQARTFLSDVLNLGPRGAAVFPKRRVCLAYWTLCSPQKGVTYNCTLSFSSLMEAVTICG